MLRWVFFTNCLVVFSCLAGYTTPEPGEEEYELALETRVEVGSPTWQPGGDWILFDRANEPLGTTGRIYKVRSDGTGLAPVTPEGYSNPVWAPDGTRFACVKDDNNEVWVLDLNGAPIRSLGRHPGFLALLDWSPDGTMIAFKTRRGDGGPYIALMTVSGEEIKFVTTGFSAAWHPSGRSLLVDDSGTDGHDHLFEVDIESRSRRQVTYGDDNDRCGTFSPDGEWIAFTSTRALQTGTGSSICLVRRDGSGLYILPFGDNVVTHAYTAPSFSPDGQYLVFGRGKWVPTDLYICRVDGTGLRKLTNFYPDGQAKGQGTLKVAKASPAPRTNAKPTAPAKPSPPAKPPKPAKKDKKNEKKGAPFPWLAPPVPLRRH